MNEIHERGRDLGFSNCSKLTRVPQGVRRSKGRKKASSFISIRQNGATVVVVFCVRHGAPVASNLPWTV
jgi:hypothetical protein